MVDPNNAIKETSEGNNVAKKNLAAPVITDVKPKYDGLFLYEVQFQNPTEISVDSRGVAISKVNVYFDQEATPALATFKSKSGKIEIWTIDLDMSRFQEPNKPNTIKVIAESETGGKSSPYLKRFQMVHVPWAIALAKLAGSGNFNENSEKIHQYCVRSYSLFRKFMEYWIYCFFSKDKRTIS